MQIVCERDDKALWGNRFISAKEKSISWDIMVWNVRYLCPETGRHRGRSQLRLLPSSADRQVFKFITVCSSQNAINKEAETLLTCDRDGCGACNKWPIRRHIYWPATNPGVLRIWHIGYWKSTEGNGKRILKFNDLHYMFFFSKRPVTIFVSFHFKCITSAHNVIHQLRKPCLSAAVSYVNRDWPHLRVSCV